MKKVELMLLVHWFNWFSDGLTTIVWSYSFVVTHLKGVEQGRYVDVLPIVGHSENTRLQIFRPMLSNFVHEYNQVGQESWETIIVLEVMGKFLEQSSYS